MKLAILSPSENQYSETFIEAHRKYLKGEIFYYCEGKHPNICNGKNINSRWNKVFSKFYSRVIKDPDYGTKAALSKSLKRNKIDVILAEYGVLAFHNIELIKKTNIPLVVHFHGFDASVYEETKKCNNYKEVFKYASYIIVVSKKMREMISELGCPAEKIILNTYGPQPEFEKVSPEFKEKALIAIGRFVNKKAPYYTILAFAKSVEKHSDAHLYLAGGGPLKEACENLVKHLKLEKNITFLGIITPEIFRSYLSKVYGFVQHSIRAKNGDMEGTPLAVLESSVSGLPVVSTIHAGIPDVIIHNETGLLCQEHDVEEMTTNMIKIFDDRNDSIAMGEKGKRHILSNFALARHIDALDEIINKAYQNK
tara:strand:- start:36 stop:1136 length:1101 start_codon:yes stop_codon:yes gene_type:complete